jgi:Fur family ferric uptake transcriptional regulator
VSWTEQTLSGLNAAGYRSGGARRAVVQLLARQGCCLTAQQIFDTLRQEGRPIGAASVYRVLDLLVEAGFVQKLDIGTGTAYYERRHDDGEHHHHVVCTSCGKVQAFADAELERALVRAQERLGYSGATHELVLHAACADCDDALA